MKHFWGLSQILSQKLITHHLLHDKNCMRNLVFKSICYLKKYLQISAFWSFPESKNHLLSLFCSSPPIQFQILQYLLFSSFLISAGYGSRSFHRYPQEDSWKSLKPIIWILERLGSTALSLQISTWFASNY